MICVEWYGTRWWMCTVRLGVLSIRARHDTTLHSRLPHMPCDLVASSHRQSESPPVVRKLDSLVVTVLHVPYCMTLV